MTHVHATPVFVSLLRRRAFRRRLRRVGIALHEDWRLADSFVTVYLPAEDCADGA